LKKKQIFDSYSWREKSPLKHFELGFDNTIRGKSFAMYLGEFFRMDFAAIELAMHEQKDQL